MVANSDRFLAAFNRIENQLNDLYNSREYIPFRLLVDRLKRKNVIVKRYTDDLYQFAELRNAIVHERINPDYVIAEPHDTTVAHIEKIDRELSQPLLVIPKFARKVYTFTWEDSLADVLKVVKEKSFTQFPVYRDGSFFGLMTAIGIAHWLAEQEDDVLSIRGTKAGEVLAWEEEEDNVEFISRKTNIYEAEELFKDHMGTGIRLSALLITENGRKSEKLLGIITPWDIIHFT